MGAVLGSLSKLMEAMAIYKPVLGVGWFYNNMYPSYFGLNVSASLYGVGYIVGPNVGGVIFLGSILQWLVTLPISAVVNKRWVESEWNTTLQGPFEPLNVARAEFKQARYVGVGLMFMGAMWALISLRKALYTSIMFGVQQFRSLTRVGRASNEHVHRYDKDVPFHYVVGGILFCIVGLYFVFSSFNNEWGSNILLAVITVIPAFLFSAVAAYMAGLVGSSNNPISGVTLCSSLIISLVILGLFGTENPLGPPTAIVMSCSVACACAISGDTIQDLKAGHILGATPWKQEAILILGVLVTSFVIAPILELLNEAYTLGVGLGAPQASIMAAIPTGIITGNLPWAYIGLGAGLAVVIICVDQVLLRMEAGFRLPVLGFAISFYLPINVMVPIFVGGLVHVVAKTSAVDQASEGVLFSAGLVSGESITGIMCAVAIAIKGNEDVMHVIEDPSAWPAIFPLLAFLGSLFYVAKYQPFSKRGMPALIGNKEKNYSVVLDELEQ